MIAYVEGRVGEVTENACIVITAGGVGYEVFLAGHSLAQLPAQGESVFFSTCTVVREDALELFGFDTWDERQTFLVLTSITRIGARTAKIADRFIAFIRDVHGGEFARAVQAREHARITPVGLDLVA